MRDVDLELAVPEIEQALLRNAQAVLLPSEFRALVRDHIPRRLRQKDIESKLQQSGIIGKVTLRSDDYHDVGRIAVLPLAPSPYHYALSIRRGSYLSHGSAVHLHGLTEQQPKTIYVNKEQSAKPKPEGPLTQDAIDRAFSRTQRRSKYVFRLKDTQVVLVSGKATGNAGVIIDQTSGLILTDLERTLIDITVRPRYAGGVFQVMSAFSRCVDQLDIEKLMTLLSTLDHKYPYHQAIGFYLERSGAGSAVLEQIRTLGTDFDFYLDYTMASPRFDTSWRVYYPLGV